MAGSAASSGTQPLALAASPAAKIGSKDHDGGTTVCCVHGFDTDWTLGVFDLGNNFGLRPRSHVLDNRSQPLLLFKHSCDVCDSRLSNTCNMKHSPRIP